MKQLYLIRHGESKEISGETEPHPRNDAALSAAGIGQAEQLAAFFAGKPVDLILTSLFRRAEETAGILKRARNAPVVSAMALNEYFMRDDYSGAETTEHGAARSMSFLYQFSPYFENIALVAHNSILATMYRELLNLPFDCCRESFESPGTCRALRYDYTQGDQNWRETESFIPE